MTAPIRFSLSTTIFLIVLSCFSPSSMAQEQKAAAPSAAALAMKLYSGDPYIIDEAVYHIIGGYSREKIDWLRRGVDPLIADGLIAALDSQCDLNLAGYPGFDDDDHIQELLEPLIYSVAALEDERAIPILLKASQFGGMAPLGLAEFGPRIFPVILDYLESSERTLQELDGGFLALMRTVERWRPLDPSTHNTLRELSIRYLQGYVPEHLTGYRRAYVLERRGMDIASVLGDPDLKPMVAALASKHPGFVEMYLERWYEGPSGAVPQELSE